jgi:hypothetical protein
MMSPKRKDLLATAVVFFTAWYVPFFHVSFCIVACFFHHFECGATCYSIVTSAAPFITRAYRSYPRYIRYLVRSVMYHICSPRVESYLVSYEYVAVYIVQYQLDLSHSYVRCKSSKFNTTALPSVSYGCGVTLVVVSLKTCG